MLHNNFVNSSTGDIDGDLNHPAKNHAGGGAVAVFNGIMKVG